jgi:hypothetical protein
MADVPEYAVDGVLPPGDYELTLAELKASSLVVGPGDKERYPSWDSDWRRRLVDSLAVLVNQLWRVGVTAIFINGSFVEDKDHPQDIDGYFHCDRNALLSGRLERDLNLLDPHKVWTWSPQSRRRSRESPKLQLPMWHVYRVELYPHVPGLLSGIRDRFGNELEFPAAFRVSRRDGIPKGIVKLAR